MRCSGCGVETLDGSRLCPICSPAERRRLEDAVRALSAGRGQIVLLRGDPGIGRSWLLEEAGDVADRFGWRVVRAADPPSGIEDALALILERLPDAVGGLGPDERVFAEGLLGRPLEGDLAVLEAAMEAPARASAGRRAAGSIVRRALEDGPLLLLVEDVHAAGPQALDLLAAVARAAAEGPLLIIATARPEGGDPFDRAWVERAGNPPLSTIDLHPLRREEAVALAAAGLPVEGPPPSSLRALLAAVIGGLDPGARHALEAAAALGGRLRPAALRQVAGDAGLQTQALVTAGLLRPDGDCLVFTHAPVRDAVHSLIPRARRRDLHRRAAAWFEGRNAALRARHLDAADDPGAAAAHAEAVREAWSRHREDGALRLAERGLAIAESREDRFDLAMVKAETFCRQGDPRRAAEAWRAALPFAAGPGGRCAAWLGLAGATAAAGQAREALAALAEAEAVALAGGLAPDLARIHNRRGQVLFGRGEVPASRLEHEQALRIALQTGTAGEEAEARAGLAACHFSDARYASAQEHLRRALDIAAAQGLGRLLIAGRPKEAFCRYYLLDIEGARAGAEASILAAARAGDLAAGFLAHSLAIEIHAESGEDGAVAAHAGQALRLARAAGAPHLEAVALAGLARARLPGDRQGAAELAGQAMSLGHRAGPLPACGRLLGALALAVRDDPRLLARILAEAAEALPHAPAADALAFHGAAIEALLAGGNWRQVEDHADALDRLTAAEAVPWAAFRAARGRALAGFAAGRRDGALLATLAHLARTAREAGMPAAAAALEQAAGGRLRG